MFCRASNVAILVLVLLTSAIAVPMKRMHYDDPSVDSVGFYEASELTRLQPETATPDPLASARRLACEPLVIRSFVEAWRATLNGTANQGLAETGFSIETYKSTISIQGWTQAEVNDLRIPTDEYTIAIAHVHGLAADERPAGVDVRSPVPNFVISQNALYVTVPGTAQITRIRGGVTDLDGWNKSCSPGLAVASR